MNAVAMQSVSSQRITLAGSPLKSAAVRAAVPRRSVAVHASAEESRRNVLAGFAALAGLAVAKTANAVDIKDARKVREKGFDLIYEAREIDLPQSVRDGLTQARSDLTAAKKRVKESEERVDVKLPEFVKKKYWTEAREELRRQVGTLRFDLSSLAAGLDKPKRKEAARLQKDFFQKVDDLDYAIRIKSLEKASEALAAAQSALDTAIAAV
ncbi:g165 [Coccomyxa viridis]|uniref:G165 protein n=1 Tax=Coccomyxa viridis TaxID=1274662 RepID=A0ABP1FJ45_9CHLO